MSDLRLNRLRSACTDDESFERPLRAIVDKRPREEDEYSYYSDDGDAFQLVKHNDAKTQRLVSMVAKLQKDFKSYNRWRNLIDAEVGTLIERVDTLHARIHLWTQGQVKQCEI